MLIFLLIITAVNYSKEPTTIIVLNTNEINFHELENMSENIVFIKHDDYSRYIAFKLKSNVALKLGKTAEQRTSHHHSTTQRKPLVTIAVLTTQTVPTKDQTNAEKTTSKPMYPLTILDNPYIINCKDLCKNLEYLSFLVVVHSSTTHFMRRSSIRETWANYNLYKHHIVRIVFLLGVPEKENTQTLIEHESLVNSDIVQGNFIDSYHNLTLKGVLWLRWVSENCPQAKLIVKVDDDVFLNVFTLLELTETTLANKKKHLFCPVRPIGTSPIQRKEGKWKIDDNEFKNLTHYPVTYCNGFFVILTSDIITDMYASVKETPFFWVDDVYVFGLLPSKVNGTKHEHLDNLNLNEKDAITCFESKEKQCPLLVATARNEGVMDKLWFHAIQQYKVLAQKYSKNGLI